MDDINKAIRMGEITGTDYYFKKSVYLLKLKKLAWTGRDFLFGSWVHCS